MTTRRRFLRSYFSIARHWRANLNKKKPALRLFATTIFTLWTVLRPTDPPLPSHSNCRHGYTSFSRCGDYDDGGGGVVACHSFSPGPLLFCIGPTIFLRPLSPPPGRLVSGEKSARRGAGGQVDCTPAPVSKVIFGCPLLLY